MKRCQVCGQRSGYPEWKARSSYLWANGHGNKVRVFCDNCGACSDITENYLSGRVKVVIVKPAREGILKELKIETNWFELHSNLDIGSIEK